VGPPPVTVSGRNEEKAAMAQPSAPEASEDRHDRPSSRLPLLIAMRDRLAEALSERG
jgi:hypothetical protein